MGLHFFSTNQLQDISHELHTILDIVDNAKQLRETIEDHKGANDEITRKNDSLTNPSAYYQYRIFNKGVSIEWSAYTWSEELQVMKRAKNWKYSVCCYGFTPIENRELIRRKEYTNTCFGEFDTIEQAIPLFNKYVLQLMKEYEQDEQEKERTKEREYIFKYNNSNTVELWKSRKRCISLYFKELIDFIEKNLTEISTFYIKFIEKR